MRILLTESQYLRLVENVPQEGFSFGKPLGRGKGGDETFRFIPGFNDTERTNTRIFKPGGSGDFNYKIVHLPKSGLDSINLYDISRQGITTALKHPERYEKKIDTESVEKFIQRTALYIRHIIGDRPVDIVTFPQTSSQLNRKIAEAVMRYYPQSAGIKLVPEMFVKNPKNISVNVDSAKALGMTDAEIHALQKRVEKWAEDEDERQLRRRIEVFKKEIEDEIRTRGRGRPSNDFRMKQLRLNGMNIVANSRKVTGRSSVVDKDGHVKDFQIKSIDDKTRRVLDGLFDFNPALNKIQYRLKGKNIILLDDNISSGATLDDICSLLQKWGVESITPITLAVLPPTVYAPSARNG